MSSASEIPHDQEEEEKVSKPQNQETIPTTPDITQQEATQVAAAESANPPTPVNDTAEAANARDQLKASSSSEATEEKATDSAQAANAQNQQNISSSPETTEEKARANPSNPPESTTSNQNQEKPSNVQQISPATGIAASNGHPKLDSSAQPTETQSRETGLSSVPECKPEEAEAKAAADATTPPKLDNTSAQSTTNEITRDLKKTDESEAPKKDLTTKGSTSPPVNETPRQDSTNAADQPPEGTTQIQYPTTKVTGVTLKHDEAPKPDSFPSGVRSKKDSTCLPFLGFHKSKEKKPQSKKKPVQDSTATTSSSKDEQSKSTTDPHKPAVSQDITATTSGQDEHTKSISNAPKPAVVQDSLTIPGKDKHSMSTTDPKKPVLAQETGTTSGKDEHSKSITDPQKTTDVQGNATTSAKDELRKLIDADIKYIEKETNKLDKYKEEVLSVVNEAKQRFNTLCSNDQGTKREFDDLRKEMTKLKLQIPSKHKADAEEKDSHRTQQAAKSSRIIPDAVKEKMPQLYKSSSMENCVEVKEFEALFNWLPLEEKLCFLCFAVFPEKSIIKKRLMVHWWIAEGFMPPRDVGTRQQDANERTAEDLNTRQEDANRKTAEEFADEYFEKLTRLGFIEPVNKKRSLYVGCYKMHPFIRLALIMMAEKAKFFNFDKEGNPTDDSSGTLQACLMGRGLLDYQDLQNEKASRDLEKLHAVFNVNEAILDFKPEWFSMMKNLNVLHLGSWKVSPTDHIEVEESNFLSGLSSMEHLKFFSLQGVSRIMELPESISNLSTLIILDLRACHSLESIHEGISCMKNLTYLDISECYLLEHMPKGISMLSNLRVLKGFVVKAEQGKGRGKGKGKNTCTLKDLAQLKKLIKLSIYTGLGEFPTGEHLKDLKKIEALKKLTMAWGGTSLHTEEHPKPQDARKSKTEETIQLTNLEKLDLKSFPKTATLDWLMPSSLKSLNKLYIRGGKFSDLGQYQYLDQKVPNEPAKNKWNVKILRLKYLSEIKMDWRELQDLFPNLIYLEKVNCPKLSFFPSDGYGVWINEEKLKQMQMRSQ